MASLKSPLPQKETDTVDTIAASRVTPEMTPAEMRPDSELDAFYKKTGCPKEFHTLITEFKEHGPTYFKASYVQTKDNWPSECVKCKRIFVCTKPKNVEGEVQVTEARQARLCPYAMREERKCVFAYCCDCYTYKQTSGTELTDPPSPCQEDWKNRKRESPKSKSSMMNKRTKRTIHPRKLKMPGEKEEPDGSIVPLENSQAKRRQRQRRQ